MTRLAPKNQELPPWVEAERPRKRPGPKPNVPSPKDMPKAKPAPEIPRLHIRIELAGAFEIVLDGEQAKEFRAVLTGGSAEDVMEACDPWTSGIELKQEIRVLEDPATMSGLYYSWAVSEESGTLNGQLNRGPGSPFYYTLKSGKPDHVDWRQVR